MPTKEGMKRLNLDLATTVMDDLDYTVKARSAGSRTEIVRRAIKRERLFVEYEQEGAELIVRKKDGTEVSIVFF